MTKEELHALCTQPSWQWCTFEGAELHTLLLACKRPSAKNWNGWRKLKLSRSNCAPIASRRELGNPRCVDNAATGGSDFLAARGCKSARRASREQGSTSIGGDDTDGPRLPGHFSPAYVSAPGLKTQRANHLEHTAGLAKNESGQLDRSSESNAVTAKTPGRN